MTATSADALTKSLKSTTTRPGNPPRWLVVVLMLVIVGGLATQGGSASRSRKRPTPVEVKLAKEVVLSGAPIGSAPQFANSSSVVYDPATNRVAVLYSAYLNSYTRDWYLGISDDGGASFAPPVSLASISPGHFLNGISLVPGPGQLLHIVTLGVDAKKKRGIEVFSTSDAGRSWQFLDRYQSESLGKGSNLIAAGRWGDDLLVCYVDEYESGRLKLIGRRIGMKTGSVASVELMELAADATLFVQPPLATNDFVLISVMEQGNVATTVHTVGMARDGTLSLPAPLEVPDQQFMTFPKLGLDASGHPYQAMVKLRKDFTPLETAVGLVGVMFNRDGKQPDLTKPGVLRRWNATTGWTEVGKSIDSPRWWNLWQVSDEGGFSVASSPRFAYPHQGFDIDRIDLSAGGWTDRWVLELPQQVIYNHPEIILRSDGAALIFAERTDPTLKTRDLVLLITDPLPRIDATELTPESPAKMP